MTTWTARDWSQLGTDIALLAARAVEMSDGAFPPASDLLQQAARLVDVKAGEEALKELREGPRHHGHVGWSPELWVDGPGVVTCDGHTIRWTRATS